MNTYAIGGMNIDSVELKCLAVSRGVRVDGAVYRRHKGTARLHINPLCCNCFLLSDGTVVQLTDIKFHLRYLSGILSWDNLRLLRYASDLSTPFSLRMLRGEPVLFYNDAEVDRVAFPPPNDFYRQKTSSSRPFVGNAVLQGTDWVAFQCLWPCEYAAAGQPCQFCFSGGDFENAVRRGKALPRAVAATDAAEIAAYAIENGARHVQITGGSTVGDGCAESGLIAGYLRAIGALKPDDSREVLLYITPPADASAVDAYFSLGATRVAFSIEVWDIARAGVITPGKINIAGRERYLRMLSYAAQKYGPARAFSNFIIGLEGFDTLAEGATRLAELGVMPTASVWMPMGRPVLGSMKTPDVDYYRRVKELFAELYAKYKLEPPDSSGLNVCIERDIWNYAFGG